MEVAREPSHESTQFSPFTNPGRSSTLSPEWWSKRITSTPFLLQRSANSPIRSLSSVSTTTRRSTLSISCLLYTSDAADDLLCVDLGGRRIITKKKKKQNHT